MLWDLEVSFLILLWWNQLVSLSNVYGILLINILGLRPFYYKQSYEHKIKLIKEVPGTWPPNDRRDRTTEPLWSNLRTRTTWFLWHETWGDPDGGFWRPSDSGRLRTSFLRKIRDFRKLTTFRRLSIRCRKLWRSIYPNLSKRFFNYQIGSIIRYATKSRTRSEKNRDN